MAIPAYQAIGTIVTQSTTTITNVAWPTHVAGDVGILFVVGRNGYTVTDPAGWTLLFKQGTGSGSTGQYVAAYWKVAASSAEGTTTVTLSSSLFTGGGIILTYRGVDPTTPSNVATGGVKSTGSTSVSVTAVTTTLANCLVIGICRGTSSTTYTSIADATLSSLTSRYQANGVFIVDGGKATTGSTGNITAGSSSPVTNSFGQIALNELVLAKSGKKSAVSSCW